VARILQYIIMITLTLVLVNTITNAQSIFADTSKIKSNISNFKNSKNINYTRNLFGTNFEVLSNRPKVTARKAKIEIDTSTIGNKISRVWEQSGTIYIEVRLEKASTIELKLFNMLGKEVRLVYKGEQEEKLTTYSFPKNDLPNGVYVCVLIGSTFRDTEKYILSR